jgi:hypothetical protein
MFSSKLILLLVVVSVIGLQLVCAAASYYYVDSAGTNDILRYNLDGTAAPAAGQSGAVFSDLPGGVGTGYHVIANNPADNYLYISSYYDYDAYQWGPGCNYVTRIDRTTGIWDPVWKTKTYGSTSGHNESIEFAQDGTLYALNSFVAGPTLSWIDIATQTATQVYTDLGTPLAVAGMQAVEFGSGNNAYVSVTGTRNKVYKYTVDPSTHIWTRDMSYGGSLGGATPWEMAYNPNDGFLYVNDYNAYIYRLNSAGVMDEISPGVPWTMAAYYVAGDMMFGPDGLLYVAGYVPFTRWDPAIGTASREVLQSIYCSGVDFSLDPTVVPEPGSLVGLCFGLGSVAAFLRRRR